MVTLRSPKIMNIRGGGLTASITPFGAALVNLYLDDYPHSLVLEYQDHNQYKANELYLGSIIGRYANRINDGTFEQNGEEYRLDRNWLDRHCLHSGRQGIAHQKWRISEVTENSLTLTIIDHEAVSGFPGDCEITVQYSLLDEAMLEIDISAKCTKPSPISITAHPYLNLGMTNTIAEHELLIYADNFLSVNAEGLPKGKVSHVKNTVFDFTERREIDNKKIDHTYCIAQNRDEIRKMAKIIARDTNIQMEIWSNETGIQFYTGDGLSGEFIPRQGLCLEPQAWPDAPNKPHFPNTRIEVFEKYRHIIRYAFAAL